jgi:hypothetical protein
MPWQKVRTYCCLGGHQIYLVQDEYKMLMWRLRSEILLDVATPGSDGITGIQNVQNDV